jgi:hypothetical protein
MLILPQGARGKLRVTSFFGPPDHIERKNRFKFIQAKAFLVSTQSASLYYHSEGEQTIQFVIHRVRKWTEWPGRFVTQPVFILGQSAAPTVTIRRLLSKSLKYNTMGEDFFGTLPKAKTSLQKAFLIGFYMSGGHVEDSLRGTPS